MQNTTRLTTDEHVETHFPQNRDSAQSKLRRGKKHCPVCLAPLGKNSTRTRLLKFCHVCQAHPSEGKHCVKCQAQSVWENKQSAACQACGLHGMKLDVIAPPTSDKV